MLAFAIPFIIVSGIFVYAIIKVYFVKDKLNLFNQQKSKSLPQLPIVRKPGFNWNNFWQKQVEFQNLIRKNITRN